MSGFGSGRGDRSSTSVSSTTALGSVVRPQLTPKKTIDQIVREHAEFTAENERLKQELQRARTAVEEAGREIQSLLEPPLTEGVIVRAIGEGKAEVMTPEGKIVSSVYTGINPESLESGRFVKLTPGKVIVKVGDYCTEGIVLEVDDVFSDGRIIVKHHLDERLTVTPTTNIDSKRLQGGNRLLCYGTLAVETLPGSNLKGILLEEKPDLRFQDLAGLEKPIQELTEDFDFLIDCPEVYNLFQMKFPKGKLLHGPPGNGKTSLVKGLVNYLSEKLNASIPFYVIHIADVYRHWLGDSENFVKSLFAETRKKAEENPFVIILLDEPETFLKKRGKGISTDANEGVINQFCAEVDGLKSLRNVMLIYGTNRLDMMDPAIIRPGRVDQKIYVPKPHKEACIQIMLKYLVAELPIDPQEMQHYQTPNAQETVEAMARAVVSEVLFADLPKYHCGTAYYPDGTSEFLYYRHIVNAALFPNIVEKAKKIAGRRYRKTLGREQGIKTSDLEIAAEQSYYENAYVNTANKDEWSKILGKEVESVRAKPPELTTELPKRKEQNWL